MMFYKIKLNKTVDVDTLQEIIFAIGEEFQDEIHIIDWNLEDKYLDENSKVGIGHEDSADSLEGGLSFKNTVEPSIDRLSYLKSRIKEMLKTKFNLDLVNFYTQDSKILKPENYQEIPD